MVDVRVGEARTGRPEFGAGDDARGRRISQRKEGEVNRVAHASPTAWDLDSQRVRHSPSDPQGERFVRLVERGDGGGDDTRRGGESFFVFAYSVFQVACLLQESVIGVDLWEEAI